MILLFLFCILTVALLFQLLCWKAVVTYFGSIVRLKEQCWVNITILSLKHILALEIHLQGLMYRSLWSFCALRFLVKRHLRCIAVCCENLLQSIYFVWSANSKGPEIVSLWIRKNGGSMGNFTTFLFKFWWESFIPKWRRSLYEFATQVRVLVVGEQAGKSAWRKSRVMSRENEPVKDVCGLNGWILAAESQDSQRV